ncbi:restriction endonuclease [Candidatus Uhrbacteria bacterium]|nr:restriction endonuclease [Candidatus Uhrbacteria bacterium]
MAWEYSGFSRDLDLPRSRVSVREGFVERSIGIADPIDIQECPFCLHYLEHALDGFSNDLTENDGGSDLDQYVASLPAGARPAIPDVHAAYRTLMECPRCGWWGLLIEFLGAGTSHGGLNQTVGVLASLKPLDLTDIRTPVEEIRRYLIAKYSDRFSCDPRKFEELVGAVFRGLGYRVRVTRFSGDDGIDVAVLEGENDSLIGVQVKRWRDKIEAGQIREFAGSLVLNGMTKGVFVTSSWFTAGAERTARRLGRAARCPLRVDLWDADDFYERLGVARLSARQRAGCDWRVRLAMRRGLWRNLGFNHIAAISDVVSDDSWLP